jgi:O-antigen/teichoic acid export membrane protein
VTASWLTRHSPSLWALGSSVVGRSTSLASALLAAAMLGPERFGGLGAILATIATLSSLAGMGFGQTLTSQLAARAETAPAELGELAASVLLVALVTGGAGAMALWLTAAPLASLGGFPSLTRELQLASPLLPLGIVAVTELGVLQGLQRYADASRWLALRALLTGAATVLGGRSGSLAQAIGWLIVAETVALTAVHWQVVAAFRRMGGALRRGNGVATVRVLSAVGAPASISAVATVVGLWAARTVLVREPSGLRDSGIFDAANRWAQLALFVPASLATIQVPVLSYLRARARLHELGRQQREWLWFGLGTTSAVSTALVFGARPMMRWVGPDYGDGTLTLVVLAVAGIPMALNSLVGPVYIAAGRMWTRCLADVALALLLVLGALVMVPLGRSAGLAAAHLLAYGCVSLWMWYRMRGLHEVSDLKQAAAS